MTGLLEALRFAWYLLLVQNLAVLLLSTALWGYTFMSS